MARLLLTIAVILLIATSTSAASIYSILHAFSSGSDGGGVWASVVFDKRGNLYGTTSGGGAYGYGTVFKLKPQPDGQWTEKILHSFDFHAEGASPTGGLAIDQDGRLHGAAPFGGAHGGGSVFELTRGPSGWSESVIYSFGDNPDDAGFPYSGVAMDAAGNLYGTAPLGGPNGAGGTVYQLTPGPGGWSETVLYGFCAQPQCADGNAPFAGVILDAKGNVYGTTEYGGAYGAGTVFKVRLMPDGTWKQRVLHTFASFPNDGVKPGVGALAFDGNGNLYGTTNQGGKNSCDTTHCGTIFRLTPQPNGHWKETILYHFKKGSSGNGPGAGVVIDSAGNLYGATLYGGTQCDCGVVYKLAPNPDGSWTYIVLHRFTGFDGSDPDANLILDDQGNLYGTTAIGGPGGAGVVFKLTP